MNELKSIRDQIMAKRSQLLNPTKIYMDTRTAALLCDELKAVCREHGGLRSGWQIDGLRVKVHDDFPEPIVF